MKDLTKVTKESYDKIAKKYAKEKFDPKVIEILLQKFIRYLKNRGVILDVGCGPGRDVKYFIGHGLKAIGIDYSEEMIKEAREKVPNAEFIEMDMRDLEFDDSTFDGIWACASLIHIPRKEIENILLDFKRILKNSGILYAGMIKGEGEIIEKKYGVPRFFTFYNQEEFEALIKKAGFEILESFVNKGIDETWITVFAKVNK